MNKQELLQELQVMVVNGEISKDEIIHTLGASLENTEGREPAVAEKGNHLFTVTRMLYVLGASIVVAGVIILIAQIWDEIGTFGRIMITFGLGLLMALLGSVLIQREPESNLGSVFHFIGGMLIPAGAIVTLNEIRLDSDWSFALIFFGVSTFYLLLSLIHKKPILTFFAIVNGTTAMYLLVDALFGSVFGYREMEALFQYLTMVLGISYMIFGSSFKKGWNVKLVGALYFFGSIGLLGAGFARVFESDVWELLFFMVVLATLLTSVYSKSRVILVTSTLFLIAHVTYITSEYFADSLGWPVALVLLGFVFIGLGYVSIAINNKYIKHA